MINDIRFAVRHLIRVPGFALAFVLTLGLGIGANTAIFSVINGVLLRPLPYPEADRIMHLRQPQTTAGVEDSSFSFPEVAQYRSQAKTIDQFVEFGDWTFNVLGRGEPHRATGGLVTANFFPMLGAQPLVGRMLVAEDQLKSAPPVAVLTVGGVDLVTRGTGGASVLGFLPVVPMTIVSALLLWIVSRLTPKARPSQATIARYFSQSG